MSSKVSDALSNLLTESFHLAEHLIAEMQDSFYQMTEHAEFPDMLLPYVDEKNAGKELLRSLTHKGLVKKFFLEISAISVSNHLMGVLRIYLPSSEYPATKFIIQVDKSQRTCWKRFIQLKELCQIYCDHLKGTTSTKDENIDSQIYHLLKQHQTLSKGPDLFSISPGDGNYTEFLSFYMAINLVFPKSYRDLRPQLSAFEDHSGDKKFRYTPYDIADAIKMPEFIVKFFMSQLEPFYKKKGLI